MLAVTHTWFALHCAKVHLYACRDLESHSDVLLTIFSLVYRINTDSSWQRQGLLEMTYLTMDRHKFYFILSFPTHHSKSAVIDGLKVGDMVTITMLNWISCLPNVNVRPTHVHGIFRKKDFYSYKSSYMDILISLCMSIYRIYFYISQCRHHFPAFGVISKKPTIRHLSWPSPKGFSLPQHNQVGPTNLKPDLRLQMSTL